jgi:hypothetical protein
MIVQTQRGLPCQKWTHVGLAQRYHRFVLNQYQQLSFSEVYNL